MAAASGSEGACRPGAAADQERVAREDFGMIRDGEILYRLVPKQP